MSLVSIILWTASLASMSHDNFFVSLPVDSVISFYNLVLDLFQFLYKGTQARDDIATEAYEEELDIGRSGSYLNNSITSAWSEHSLDPEDIRVKRPC